MAKREVVRARVAAFHGFPIERKFESPTGPRPTTKTGSRHEAVTDPIASGRRVHIHGGTDALDGTSLAGWLGGSTILVEGREAENHRR